MLQARTTAGTRHFNGDIAHRASSACDDLQVDVVCGKTGGGPTGYGRHPALLFKDATNGSVRFRDGVLLLPAAEAAADQQQRSGGVTSPPTVHPQHLAKVEGVNAACSSPDWKRTSRTNFVAWQALAPARLIALTLLTGAMLRGDTNVIIENVIA